MSLLNQTWDSLQFVSNLNTTLKWVVAVSGIAILIISRRETVLRERVQSRQHDKLAATEQAVSEQQKQIHAIRYGRRAGDL